MPVFFADVHLTRPIRRRHYLATARALLVRGHHGHDDTLADADPGAEHWPEAPTP
jgi:hypothetical protein